MSRNSFIQQLENLCDEFNGKLNELDDNEKQVLSTCYTLLGTYYSNDRSLNYLSNFVAVLSQTIVSTNIN